jgi:hypothetical protein
MLLPDGQFQPKITTVVPYTHTGILAEYSLDCHWTLYGGWTAGWDTGFDRYDGGSTFLGGFTYAFNDCIGVNYSTIMGDFGRIDGPNAVRSDSDGYLHAIVFDWDVTSCLNWVVQSNYGDNGLWFRAFGAGGTVPVAGNGKVFSVTNYLLYTINCCWAVGSRLEWLKIGGTDEYAEVTLGANYRPCANVIVRPEVRIGEFDGTGVPQDQTTFAVDAILTF